MKRNRLQRLKLPNPGRVSSFCPGIDTFSGLTTEDRKELFSIARFEYMGNVKYERGVIPQSLIHICENRPAYQLHERVIKGVTFFIIIPQDKIDEYVSSIESWSEENYIDEYHGLKDVVTNNNDTEMQGWLDLDDHVIFFINQDMAIKMDEFLHLAEKVT
jgi:hypothetical protein